MLLGSCLFLGATCQKQGPDFQTSWSEQKAADEIYLKAESFYEAGDYDNALPLYQQVIEEHPGLGVARNARFRAGQIYLKKGDGAEALKWFKGYSDLYGNDSELSLAQNYAIKILESRLAETTDKYESMLLGYEQQNFRLKMLNQSLRRSVDSEVIYLEVDLESDRLLVKLGTQALYEYPVVTGKGRGRLRSFHTPKGVRQIESIEKDPKWYRPDWVWTEKGLEVPEGITMAERAVPYVLGPYKVSFGDGYFIHGTRGGKIRPGKYSHGCVRMNNHELRQLVKMIDVGTMLYIY